MATQADSAEPVERIYIGGLDPPRLTAQDVLNRLPKDRVQIHSVESYSDKPFCHITATTADKSTTALQILFSVFNNVKWKSSRLIVQAPRPHILERLEQERNERHNRTMNNPSKEEVDNQDQQIKQSKIPRRLRIRKKFGDEAFHVDTKPWLVDDWSNFGRAVGKQRKRDEKHKMETQDARTPLMHRAIHIRFDSERSTTIGHKQSDEQDNNESPDVLIERSDDSSSESESDDSSSNDKDNTRKSGYTWSDEEISEDDLSGQNKLDASEERRPEQFISTSLPQDDHSDVGSSTRNSVSSAYRSSKESTNEKYSQSTQHVPVASDIPMFIKNTMPNKNYHCSEDDDLVDDENDLVGNPEEESNKNIDLSSKHDWDTGKHLPSIASVAHLGISSSTDNDDEDKSDSEEEVETVDGHVPRDADLSNDVSANLNILSSLFPEIATTKPANFTHDAHRGVEGEKLTNTSGFGASGIMLRFDPNDAATQKFEIGESKVNEGSTKIDKENEAKVTGEDSTVSAKETIRFCDQPTIVYEQQKLEEVFKEAREAWKGGNVGEKSPTALAESSSGGSFTFGFDLVTSKKEEPQSSGSFNFGFDIPDIMEEKVAMSTGTDHEDQQFEISTIEKLGHTTTKTPERRRRGFLFPDDALVKYESSFFTINDGIKIMKDVESFKRDPEVTEAWKKERHTLTMDWKRKRKYAQSRIQKKMKIR